MGNSGEAPIEDRGRDPRKAVGGRARRRGRGILLVVEGADKVGKSNLCRDLKEHFERVEERDCEMIAFPVRSSASGKLLNAYLKEELHLSPEASHLIFSANRWEHADLIEEALKGGKLVICDRYVYSGRAYSRALRANLTEDQKKWFDHSDKGLPEADLVLFLGSPRRRLFRRRGPRDPSEKYERGGGEFRGLVEREFQRVLAGLPFDFINVWNKDRERIKKEALVYLGKRLGKMEERPSLSVTRGSFFR